MDLNVRRKTLPDFRLDLRACTDAAAAREVVAAARTVLSRDDYRELQDDYRNTFEAQTQ